MLRKQQVYNKMILDEENTKEIYMALKNLYIEEALRQFAKDINLPSDDLQKIETEPIAPDVGKKLRNLWIIKSGTTYFPAPKPRLEPIKSEIIDEAQSRLIDLLKNIPIEELEIKLKIGHVQLQNYLENRESISLDVAIKLRFLWAIEFGTSYIPGPRSIIDEQLESSVYDSVYKFIGENEKEYKITNIKDVLPHKIEDIDYDGALQRVIPEINKILHIFYKKSLKAELSRELSSGTTTVVPKFRTFEIEILEDRVMQYYFIYGKGKIIDSSESLHYKEIADILKNDGAWEN